MKVMYKNILTLLCCICFFVHANAQEQSIAEEGRMYDDRPNRQVTTKEYDTEVQIDDEEVEEEYTKKYNNFGKEVQGDTLINFNDFELSKDSVNEWKNNKNFAWIKTIEEDLKQNLEEESDAESESNKSKKQRVGEDKDVDEEGNTVRRRRISGGGGGGFVFNSGILKLILWSLAGIFICFLVYNLFLNGGKFGKVKKESKVVEIEETVNEDNMDNDFASLQKKAYDAGDTRLAMRYMFLKMLQTLQQKGYIQFVADKTNAAYATEIKDGFRNEFSSLAMYFEYVWYGKLDIEKEVFDKIENKYNKFLNRI